MLGELHHLVEFVCVSLAVIVLLGACSSDPSPMRVAEDIIKAESERDPSLDKDCLLARLDEYTDAELRDIGSRVTSEVPSERKSGRAELQEFQESLASCTPAGTTTTTVPTTVTGSTTNS